MDVRNAIYHYCNYQPRCHKEVRNKLYELNCRTAEVESYISELIEKDVLNEERYAKAIARGKFRLKQWGKNKIIQQLRLNQVSDYCIKKALKEIDGEGYYKTLTHLSDKKWEELKKERSQQLRKAKLYRYLLQKGYEMDLIQERINEIIMNRNA